MENAVREENIILKLSLEFALMTIDYCELLESQKKLVVSRQLLKSGTSIGTNLREMQHAESKTDFIHKLKVAMKEAEETSYRIELRQKSEHYPDCAHRHEKIKHIKKVLSKILITMKSKP